MLKLLKDCLTIKNGEDYDIGRVLLLMIGTAFVLYTGYDLYHGAHFDTNNFGLGGGAILGGGGAGIGFKGKTEPEQ